MTYLFQLCVYLFGIYLLTLNKKLKLVGLAIILSHLYKDITKMKKWPLWCDLGGLILSFILVKEGMKLNNNIVERLRFPNTFCITKDCEHENIRRKSVVIS